MKPKLLQLSALICCSILLTQCKKEPIRGCMDNNSTYYNPSAVEDDGSCVYRYAQSVRVDAYPSNSPSSLPWDVSTNPDLYMIFSKNTSSSWDYSTQVANDAYMGATQTITSTDIKFTNESWKFELRDDDGGGTYEVMVSGTFNPLQDKQAAQLSLGGGGAYTIYFFFTIH